MHVAGAHKRAIAQFINICRWLPVIHEHRLTPLENAPVSTP
jgi:hypothetical protein